MPLPLLVFNFSFKYAIRQIQDNPEGLEHTSSCPMLIMLIYWAKAQNIKKNREMLIQANQEVSLEITKRKACVQVSLANKSSENVTAAINQNYIHE
jgi:hypothetical protein